MIAISKRPPKYYCNACGIGFRRRKKHDDHVLYGRCKAMKKLDRERKKTKKQAEQIDSVIAPMERIIDQSYDTPSNLYLDKQHWYSAPYDYHYPGLATGNSHLRCGLPFVTDPLRRTIVRPVLPSAMPSLGSAPTLSKHKYGAQAI